MELRQLEYFLAVADEGGFTRAAERMHVAQPGVSAQIRKLERELGHDLLDRSARSVRLTEVGEAVLPRVRAALAAVADINLVTAELAGLVRGRVVMGMVVACGGLDLPGLLAGYHAAHPDVEISLTEAGSADLLRGLLDGSLDLAVVGLTETVPPGVAVQVVADEPLVAAVAPGHPLAARATVPLAELRDHGLISLPVGTGLRGVLDDACGRLGFRPRITFEASDPALLAQLAGSGLGVAILPGSMVAARAGELVAVRVTRPTLRGRLALAWRQDAATLGPASRVLIAHARTVLGGESPAA